MHECSILIYSFVNNKVVEKLLRWRELVLSLSVFHVRWIRICSLPIVPNYPYKNVVYLCIRVSNKCYDPIQQLVKLAGVFARLEPPVTEKGQRSKETDVEYHMNYSANRLFSHIIGPNVLEHVSTRNDQSNGTLWHFKELILEPMTREYAFVCK